MFFYISMITVIFHISINLFQIYISNLIIIIISKYTDKP